MSWPVTASAIAQAAPRRGPRRPLPAAERRRRQAADRGRRRRSAFDDDDGDEGDARAPREPPRSAAPSPAAAPPAVAADRVLGFLRASWAELQRVQWPDRRQVGQATGVVLGFVIIAGVFLGVADYVAGKIINAII